MTHGPTIASHCKTPGPTKPTHPLCPGASVFAPHSSRPTNFFAPHDPRGSNVPAPSGPKAHILPALHGPRANNLLAPQGSRTNNPISLHDAQNIAHSQSPSLQAFSLLPLCQLCARSGQERANGGCGTRLHMCAKEHHRPMGTEISRVNINKSSLR